MPEQMLFLLCICLHVDKDDINFQVSQQCMYKISEDMLTKEKEMTKQRKEHLILSHVQDIYNAASPWKALY